VKRVTRYLLLLIYLATHTVIMAQSDTIPSFTEERPAAFPGGLEKMKEYLSLNIIYPREARKQGITGTVHISFVVDSDGTIMHVHVDKGVHPLLDSAAVELITNMPKWEPGFQRGRYVKSMYVLPIEFRLTKSTPRAERKARRSRPFPIDFAL